MNSPMLIILAKKICTPWDLYNYTFEARMSINQKQWGVTTAIIVVNTTAKYYHVLNSF